MQRSQSGHTNHLQHNKCKVLSQDTPITCTLNKIQGAVSCLHARVLAAYHRMLFVLWYTYQTEGVTLQQHDFLSLPHLPLFVI
jgi:hypothetical protein